MIESFNFFPESRYFKVKNNVELDHQCGGLSSLFIIMICLAVLMLKFREVWQMGTITFDAETSYKVIPDLATLSTYQNDTNHNPFMVAVGVPSDSCYNITTTALHNSHYNIRTAQYTKVDRPITLEKCTSEHFSQMPVLRDNINTLGINNWLCLPLNQTYEVGGNVFIGSYEKSFYVKFKCESTCKANDCGNIQVYQINSIINAQNHLKPFQQDLHRTNIFLTNSTYRESKIYMDDNILDSDTSVMPFLAKHRRRTAVSNQPSIFRHEYQSLVPEEKVWFERSPVTKHVSRKYLTLLDVLSYVGGIFPSLFGIFFFMKFFGTYFFEMTFAYQHFKCREASHHHFTHFLKKSVYSLLKFAGCEMKNWKIAQKQIYIHDTVNNIMEINYLFQRIEYLERAISLIFDEHQLKGIYLSHVDLHQAYDGYKKRQLRDRFIKYLDKKAIKEKEKARQEQIKNDSNVLRTIGKKHRKSSKELMIKRELFPEEPDRVNQRKKAQIVSDEERREYQLLIRREAQMIEGMTDEDLNEEKLEQDMEYDLKRLFREARRENGDLMSRKIVEGLDEHLRNELEMAIDEYERDNWRFEMNLRSVASEND